MKQMHKVGTASCKENTYHPPNKKCEQKNQYENFGEIRLECLYASRSRK